MARYRISQIKLRYDEPKSAIKNKIIKALGKQGRVKGKPVEITGIQPVKESIDARKKPDIYMIYTVDFDCKAKLNLPLAPDMSYREVPSGAEEMKHRPIVVGFGPCGMFAALVLARRGLKPMVLERGYKVEERVAAVERFWKEGILDPECNVQFGEGGAGTFSDGKLTTGIKDPRIRFVLEEFVKAGADPAILYEQKPHIGTDVLRTVVKNIRLEIESLGGEIYFGNKLESLITEELPGGGFKLRGINITYPGADGSRVPEELISDDVIIAIGHSSRDTFRMLNDASVSMEQKQFSIGVRVEHPQSMVDISQYGEEAAASGKLPPAAYKLNHHCENGRGVYTFCMCPGGEVVPAASSEGMVVINGMSNHDRDSGTANSALLVDVLKTDFPDPDYVLSGVDFQEKYERLAYENSPGGYKPPVTSWGELKRGGAESESAKKLAACLPDFALTAMREAMPHLGRRLKGFDADDTVVKAVETRSSSPVRILRDFDSMESLNVAGLYPGGEGAGYAGGITSSACDGIKLAEKIISKYSC